VRLSPGRLKLHINDHRPATIARFERALAEAVAAADRVLARTGPERVAEART
jgi:hypothetical protein